MGGYYRYSEAAGEVVHEMYTYPFIVRGCDPRFDGDVSLAGFRTKAEAETFIARYGDQYLAGGMVNIHIENWNE